MSEWHLTLLIVASLTGACLFAWKEAALIVADKELNHVLLTVFRLLLAMLVLTPLLPRPVEIPTLGMSLLMMMGTFAPFHRLVLNARRMDLGHRIPIYHLGKGPYDSLWMILSRGNMMAAYLTMSAFELTIAAAMYIQLT